MFAILLIPLVLFFLKKAFEGDKSGSYYYYYVPGREGTDYVLHQPPTEDRREEYPTTTVQQPTVISVEKPWTIIYEQPVTSIQEGRAQQVDTVEKPPPPQGFERVWRYYDYAIAASRALGVAPSLILSIIRVESSGNPNAVGSAGEIGLMQIKPSTAFYMKRLGYPCPINKDRDLFDPYTNIMCGTSYLAYLKDKYLRGEHNPWLMAYGYNAGEGNLRYYLQGKRTVSRAVDYANKVSSYMTMLRRVGIA